MKRHIFYAYIFALVGLFATCKKKSSASTDKPCIIQEDSVAIASKLLTLTDAEKMMGETATLTCNTMMKERDRVEYKCDYTAVAQDTVTAKTGKLFFVYEEFTEVGAAQNAYAAIYEGNKDHAGVDILPGVGDEAYYHTDNTGFYFLIVRKNEKMFRLKLNKITSHSSETNFKQTATLILDRI